MSGTAPAESASRGVEVRFPANFLWGTATAAHQVEGDNVHSDWWEYEQDGRLPHRSGAACDHYHRYAQDFDLARSLHQNAHRLSLEWSRIEPRPGQWDEAAIEHYAAVLAALHSRNIEPLVTLHHFTLPAWFLRQGGWLHDDAIALFARYVTQVAERLGERVRYWLTINEPTVYIKQAFVSGRWPPCRRGAWGAAHRALRSLCRAHTAAYDILHARHPQARVGFAHSAPHVAPRNPYHPHDRLVAALRDQVLNHHCFRLLGRPAARALDFIGLNYYTRQLVRGAWRGSEPLLGRECLDTTDPSRSFNDLGWEIHPDGLTAVLRRFSEYGLPLIVTENGIATDDEAQRSRFLAEHLRALGAAVRSGLDVRGYFYWSLIDNFEWAEGFEPHFGLAAVAQPSLARVPRPAAHQFAAICARGSVFVPE